MSNRWLLGMSCGVGMVFLLAGAIAQADPPRSPAPNDTKAARDNAGNSEKQPHDSSINTSTNTEREAGDAVKGNHDAGDNAPRDANESTKGPRKETTRDAHGAAAAVQDRAREARTGVRRTDRELGINFGRVSDRGLDVSSLAADSPIYKSGLRRGDYIVSINGHRVEGSADFDRWVYAGEPGERVRLVIWRDGREETIYVEPNVFYVENTYDEERPIFGIDFNNRYPDRIVILRVHPDSAAFRAGLRAGDEITSWNGQRVESPAEFARIIHQTGPGSVNFEYMRDSKTTRAEARFNRREDKTNEAPPAAGFERGERRAK